MSDKLNITDLDFRGRAVGSSRTLQTTAKNISDGFVSVDDASTDNPAFAASVTPARLNADFPPNASLFMDSTGRPHDALGVYYTANQGYGLFGTTDSEGVLTLSPTALRVLEVGTSDVISPVSEFRSDSELFATFDGRIARENETDPLTSFTQVGVTDAEGFPVYAPVNNMPFESSTVESQMVPGYADADSDGFTSLTSEKALFVKSYCASGNGSSEYALLNFTLPTSGVFTIAYYASYPTVPRSNMEIGASSAGARAYFGLTQTTIGCGLGDVSWGTLKGTTVISPNTVYKIKYIVDIDAKTVVCLLNDLPEFNGSWTGTLGVGNVQLWFDPQWGNYSNTRMWDVKIAGRHYPLQGSLYDVSGNDNHGVVVGTINLFNRQDHFHYNITKGFAEGPEEIFNPDCTNLANWAAPIGSRQLLYDPETGKDFIRLSFTGSAWTMLENRNDVNGSQILTIGRNYQCRVVFRTDGASTVRFYIGSDGQTLIDSTNPTEWKEVNFTSIARASHVRLYVEPGNYADFLYVEAHEINIPRLLDDSGWVNPIVAKEFPAGVHHNQAETYLRFQSNFPPEEEWMYKTYGVKSGNTSGWIDYGLKNIVPQTGTKDFEVEFRLNTNRASQGGERCVCAEFVIGANGRSWAVVFPSANIRQLQFVVGYNSGSSFESALSDNTRDMLAGDVIRIKFTGSESTTSTVEFFVNDVTYGTQTITNTNELRGTTASKLAFLGYNAGAGVGLNTVVSDFKFKVGGNLVAYFPFDGDFHEVVTGYLPDFVLPSFVNITNYMSNYAPYKRRDGWGALTITAPDWDMSEPDSATYWQTYGANNTLSREVGGTGQVMRATKDVTETSPLGFSRKGFAAEFRTRATYEVKLRIRCSASLAAKNKPVYLYTCDNVANVSGPAHAIGTWTEEWRTATIRSNCTYPQSHISALGPGLEAGDWLEIDWIEAREIFIPMKYDGSGFVSATDSSYGKDVVLTHFNKADSSLWSPNIRASVHYDTTNPTDWAGPELIPGYLHANKTDALNNRLFSATVPNTYTYNPDGSPIVDANGDPVCTQEPVTRALNLQVFKGSLNATETERLARHAKTLAEEE